MQSKVRAVNGKCSFRWWYWGLVLLVFSVYVLDSNLVVSSGVVNNGIGKEVVICRHAVSVLLEMDRPAGRIYLRLPYLDPLRLGWEAAIRRLRPQSGPGWPSLREKRIVPRRPRLQPRFRPRL